MPIHVISTYAPRSGRKEGKLNNTDKVRMRYQMEHAKKHRIIWGEDAIGQIGTKERDKTNKLKEATERIKQIVGTYTRSKVN